MNRYVLQQIRNEEYMRIIEVASKETKGIPVYYTVDIDGKILLWPRLASHQYLREMVIGVENLDREIQEE